MANNTIYAAIYTRCSGSSGALTIYGMIVDGNTLAASDIYIHADVEASVVSNNVVANKLNLGSSSVDGCIFSGNRIGDDFDMSSVTSIASSRFVGNVIGDATAGQFRFPPEADFGASGDTQSVFIGNHAYQWVGDGGDPMDLSGGSVSKPFVWANTAIVASSNFTHASSTSRTIENTNSIQYGTGISL